MGVMQMSENKEHPTWGGRRKNQTGRPKKPEGVRKMRSLRASDDEWELIKKFAAMAKDDIDMAANLVEKGK